MREAREPDRTRSDKGASSRPSARVAAALAYDPAADAAPRLVAAGRGPLAERIVAVAAENGVAVRENGELAEVLAALDLGQTIPVALYAAVAEILAFLHRRPADRAAAAETGERP